MLKERLSEKKIERFCECLCVYVCACVRVRACVRVHACVRACVCAGSLPDSHEIPRASN